MKPVRNLIISLAIFGVTAGSVWLIREGRPEAPAARGAEPAKSKVADRERTPRKKEIPADVAARLATIRNARTPGERLRATIHLAQTLPVGDLEAWYEAEWFDGEEDMQTYLFHRITRARWFEADPEGLVKRGMAEDGHYLGEVASAWAKRDPAAAMAFVDSLEKPEQQSRLLTSMREALIKASPVLVVENLLKIHAALGSNYRHAAGDIVRQLATANPEVLKARLDDLPAGLRETARAGLAKVALNENFSAGVTELAQMKGGMDLFFDALMGDPKLIEQAAGDPSLLPPGWFASMATRNPYALVREDPAKWLEADLESMGLSAAQARQVRQSAMGQLASKDPDRVAAMIASGECEESQRQNAISSVAARYSADKEKLDAWLATLTGAGDLDAAKQAIESQGGTTQGELANPGSLLASLAGGGTELTYHSSMAMATWGPEKRAEFTDAFDELDKAQKPVVAAKFLDNHFDSIPMEMRGHLVGYLLAHPPEPSPDATARKRGQPVGQVASKLAAEWADQDPSAASRWVGSLPAGEDRLWAAKNLAARWAEYEPAATRRWIATLPGEESKAVQEHLNSEAGTRR